MILLNINPVNDTIEMSKAISELGVLIVLAGLMVVFFISMVYFVFKVMRSTNSKLLESQAQMIEQNKVIQGLLSKLAEQSSVESLLEQTKWNAEKLLKASFDANLIVLMKGASEILSHNHIDDKDFTETRIRALVNSSHFERTKWLNNFKYNGSRLGDLANSESWVEKKVGIIRRFIYSSEKNRDVLMRDLSLAYVEFNVQLEL